MEPSPAFISHYSNYLTKHLPPGNLEVTDHLTFYLHEQRVQKQQDVSLFPNRWLEPSGTEVLHTILRQGSLQQLA